MVNSARLKSTRNVMSVKDNLEQSLKSGKSLSERKTRRLCIPAHLLHIVALVVMRAI